MTTSTGANTDASPDIRWAARIIEWHWKRSLAIAVAAFVVLAGAMLAIHALAVYAAPHRSATAGSTPGSGLRMGLVLALIAAYTLGSSLFGLATVPRELDRLRSLVRLGDEEWQAIRNRLTPSVAALLRATGIGALAGAGLSVSDLLADGRIPFDAINLETLPFMMLVFGLMFVAGVITIRASWVFHEIGRRHVEPDLLDLDRLSAFANVGFLCAATWLIGSALASLLFTSVSNGWIVLGVLVATVGLGMTNLMIPSMGVHQRIREAKRIELGRIRRAIDEERSLLLESERFPDRWHEATHGLAERSSRMTSLLAYESRIASVREWPFDTSTLGRFGLVALIPLASWIGGALVERAVNSALG